MRLMLKLLGAHWRKHWLRTLLAISAIAAAVALVIVVVAGWDLSSAMSQAAVEKADDALGHFSLTAMTSTPEDAAGNPGGVAVTLPLPPMSDSLLGWLHEQPHVESVFECCQVRVRWRDSGALFRTKMYRPSEMKRSLLFGTTSSQPPKPLSVGQWLTDDAGDKNFVVVDSSVAKQLGGDVGTTFQMLTPTGRYDVTICGVIESGSQSRETPMYVGPKTFERLVGQPLRTNRVWVELAQTEEVTPETFSDQFRQAAERAGSPVLIDTAESLRQEAQANPRRAGGRRRGSGIMFFPLLRDAQTNMALLAAMFTVFATFSMGLQERARQLAMLRAIGMTRGQVVAMVFTEAIVLATIGWIVGIAAGYYLAGQAIASGQGDLAVSVHVNLWVLTGALVAYGATLIAAAFPTAMALRRRPLDEMSGAPLLSSSRITWWPVVVGLLLISISPALVLFVPSVTAGMYQTLSVLALGLLASMVGMAMLISIILRIFEGPFSRIGGLLFGLNSGLLRRHLSQNQWRTVGCTAVLMIGLGMYVTFQVWGQSMLIPFMPPERTPDAVISVLPEGLPEDKLSEVASLDGVEKVLPLVVQHPSITDVPADFREGMFFGYQVLYVGCDTQALLGEEGMYTASFVRGDREEAFAKLADGKHCLVTSTIYLRSPAHYDVGNEIVLDTVDDPRRTITYTIAGVVDMPGWHMLTMSTQMRRNGLTRACGMLFVPTETAKAAYPGTNYRTLWMHLKEGVLAGSLEEPIIRLLDPDAKVVTPETSDRSARAGRGGGPGGVATAGASAAGRGGRGGGRGGRGGGPGGGPGGGAAAGQTLDSRFYCRAADMAGINASILRRSNGIIQNMVNYAWLALGLSSLAVISTMTMSVRVRSWELGVLRSLGLTRGQTLRQVLAEGFLIGLLACVTSLLFGLLTAWVSITASSRMMCVYAPFFVPWTEILLGMAAAVALCVGATIWPALTTALRQPLALLQAGRAAQ